MKNSLIFSGYCAGSVLPGYENEGDMQPVVEGVVYFSRLFDEFVTLQVYDFEGCKVHPLHIAMALEPYQESSVNGVCCHDILCIMQPNFILPAPHCCFIYQ
jgi:hypothetical protein